MDGIERSHSQDCSTSDLTDTENEGQESGIVGIGEGRGAKRGYGTVVDCGEPTTSERTLRTRRVRDQFALLRSAVPNYCTTSKGVRASILTGAYEYIEKLQKQEAELRRELGLESSCEEEEELSSCEDEVSCWSRRESDESSKAAGCSEFESLRCGRYCGCWSRRTWQVEVARTEEGSLRIHIDCRMRPCLLREIMELLESSGLTVEGANVNCMERLVFDGIGLEEVEGTSDGGENGNIGRVSAEFVGASLRSLIGDQRPGDTVLEGSIVTKED